MSKFVVWRPINNRQKGALSRFPGEWEVVKHTARGDKLLIKPKNTPDGDLRWIDNNQVILQRWEIESVNPSVAPLF